MSNAVCVCSGGKGAQLLTRLSTGNVAFFKKIHVHYFNHMHCAVFTAEEELAALAFGPQKTSVWRRRKESFPSPRTPLSRVRVVRCAASSPACGHAVVSSRHGVRRKIWGLTYGHWLLAGFAWSGMRPWTRVARLATIKTRRSRKTPPALKLAFTVIGLPPGGRVAVASGLRK
eukprot:5687707-Prymnesium_polylepis.1